MASKRAPKVIFIGNAAVGKTSIINSYAHKSYAGNYKATIGADFHQFEVEIEGKVRNLEIWDTAGQQNFNSLGQVFYRGSHCCVIVFDLTDPDSFEALEKWRQGFIRGCDPNQPAKFPFIILGNKVDLVEKRKVSKESIEQYIQNKENFTFFQVSAKNQTGLAEVIKKIGEIAIAQNQERIFLPFQDTIKIGSKRKIKNKSCC